MMFDELANAAGQDGIDLSYNAAMFTSAFYAYFAVISFPCNRNSCSDPVKCVTQQFDGATIARETQSKRQPQLHGASSNTRNQP
jgi:hypothetical protein